MCFFRFARNYSEVCPEGEAGDFHISVGIGRITREVLEYHREKGFRLDEDE